VHLLNKRQDTSTVALDVEGLPDAEVRVVGLDAPGKPLIPIGPDQGREVRFLTIPDFEGRQSTPLTFRATDTATGETDDDRSLRRPRGDLP
jgi:hypothetical protein